MSFLERFLRLLTKIGKRPRRWLALFIAQLLWWFAFSRKKIALTNLALCFPEVPELQRRRWARELFTAFTVSLVDRSILWFGTEAQIHEMVRLEGIENIPTDRSFLFLCPHFIGMDVAWTRISMERQGAGIYTSSKNAKVEEVLRKGRGRFNNPSGAGKHEGARRLLEYIRAGIPLFYLPDMDYGIRDGIFVPFFGIPAATLTTLPRLAHKYALDIVPVITTWDARSGHYTVKILPALKDYPSDDITAGVIRMNQEIEAWIRQQPSQYYWVHKRFKTRPEGEPNVY